MHQVRDEIDDHRFSRRSERTPAADADFHSLNFRLDLKDYFKPEHAKLLRFGGRQFPGGCGAS